MSAFGSVARMRCAQSGEFSDDVSTATQLRRNRSTRSLWDSNYVDESWIGDKVRLIPRMREWAAGLPIGITEYNWGAEGDMNGATAQADVLGIFGREGLGLAARAGRRPRPSRPRTTRSRSTATTTARSRRSAIRQ